MEIYFVGITITMSPTGLYKHNFRRRIVNVFLQIFLAYVLGAQKNLLT